MRFETGTIALLSLEPTRGHEQRGTRPCVIVSAPEVSADQRLPLIAIIPISGTPGEGALYPVLAPGRSGLRKQSQALIDQVRSVDKGRIERLFGRVSTDELAAIDSGLALFLGLE